MDNNSNGENGPLALLNLLSQNNFSINNLNFLENRQNELSRLINFIGVLIDLNVQLKDLDHVKEILTFFQNLSKINNSNIEHLLENNIINKENNDNKENDIFEKPLELNEKNNFNLHKEKEKENKILGTKQKIRNFNSISTNSQEQKSENNFQEKVFPYTNNNFNNIIIENKKNNENFKHENFNENENDYEENLQKNSSDIGYEIGEGN